MRETQEDYYLILFMFASQLYFYVLFIKKKKKLYFYVLGPSNLLGY